MNKQSNYLKLLLILLPLPALAYDEQASLEQYPTKDIVAYFQQAQQKGLTGIAQKSKSVYARLATPGEIIKTIIKGVGTEVISSPAEEGDWVVENIVLPQVMSNIWLKKQNFTSIIMILLPYQASLIIYVLFRPVK